MPQEEKQKIIKIIRELVIPEHYAGPPQIANGGYICGLLARYIAGAAEVTIKVPTPLDHPLQIGSREDGSFILLNGNQVLVEARPCAFDLEIPEVPGFQEAVEAAKTSIALQPSPYGVGNLRGIHPICFCCGADVPDGKGLKIHPGRLNGAGLVAAPWIPAKELGDGQGMVRPEFIWTVLDCPGAFAFMELTSHRPGLSGRLIGRLDRPLQVGDPCVVIAWPMDVEGKKLFAGSALVNSQGQVVGRVKATWIDRSFRVKNPS
ncbi:MAG: hypothetical protein AB1585_07900 [Thermodesulfobacteriota bacterium]